MFSLVGVRQRGEDSQRLLQVDAVGDKSPIVYGEQQMAVWPEVESVLNRVLVAGLWLCPAAPSSNLSNLSIISVSHQTAFQ